MKLLVDVGNSRVKWAIGTVESFVSYGEAPLDHGSGLRPLFESQWAPDEIRIANVAGTAAGARLAAALEERFRIVPRFARSASTGAGVRNGYIETGQLGVDRWLAICAAYARYRGPICVADAGTATTIDLVAADGDHQGGLILPGMELMQAALLRGTGDLARLSEGSEARDAGPLLGGSGPENVPRSIVLGRDTGAAIRYGALQATASLVLGCMARFGVDRLSGTTLPVLLLTGGGAPALKAALIGSETAPGGLQTGFRLEYRPHLVLEGLALDPICFGIVG